MTGASPSARVAVVAAAALPDDGCAVVNNAGMAMQGDLDPDVAVGDMADAQWAAVLRRNLDTCFHLTRAAVPHLERSGSSRVVNVASARRRRSADRACPTRSAR